MKGPWEGVTPWFGSPLGKGPREEGFLGERALGRKGPLAVGDGGPGGGGSRRKGPQVQLR